jgi:hypothetical protein
MCIPRARITAPAVHVCLFVVAYGYWLLFERGAHHNNARLDLISIVWIMDLPIAILASFLTLGIGLGVVGRAQTAFAFTVWFVLGTIWWYFLGISIEAWIRRFSRKAGTVRGLNS